MIIWQWIKPMLYTGVICIVLGAIVAYISVKLEDSGYHKTAVLFTAISCVLCIPIVIAVVGGIINMVWNIFNWIWAPYI